MTPSADPANAAPPAASAPPATHAAPATLAASATHGPTAAHAASATHAASAPARSVVIVGHVCIDENTGTGGPVPAAPRREPGSPAFFMNRQLRRMPGAGVSVIAPYGVDLLEVDDTLPLLNAPQTGETLLYRNHIEGDVRRQECFHAGGADPVPFTAVLQRAIAQADIVIVAPLLANVTPAYLDTALAPARPDALTLLLVQGYLRAVDVDGRVRERPFAEYAEVLPRFDVAVFSDEDLHDALSVARRWSREFPRTTLVVTQNRQGATFFRDGTGVNVPAVPLEREALGPAVGNVIGAGDVFSAALALGYREGGDIRSAVQRANEAAGAFIDGERRAALAA